LDLDDLVIKRLWIIPSSTHIHPSSCSTLPLRQGAQYPQDAVVILGPPLATADEHLATEGLRGVFVVGFGPDAELPNLDGKKKLPHVLSVEDQRSFSAHLKLVCRFLRIKNQNEMKVAFSCNFGI
jgi:hypothetical protein